MTTIPPLDFAVTSVGNYPERSTSYLFWSVGDTIRIQALGMTDGVPAFTRDMTAPPILQLTTPTFDGATPLTISRSAGLDLSWPPVAGSNMSVRLIAHPG